ncbi:hypothetical protein D3C81_1393500 [compost metagenome]
MPLSALFSQSVWVLSHSTGEMELGRKITSMHTSSQHSNTHDPNLRRRRLVVRVRVLKFAASSSRQRMRAA